MESERNAPWNEHFLIHQRSDLLQQAHQMYLYHRLGTQAWLSSQLTPQKLSFLEN